MAPFSQRSRRELRTNAFSRALAEAQSSLARATKRFDPDGRDLLDLSSGNPTAQGLGLAADELGVLLSDPALAQYEPTPFGLHSARAAVCAELLRQGFALAPAQIMLTASTSEAYSFLFKLLCDPGDAVLIPEPSYPLLEELAVQEGVALIRYALRYDGEWHIDPASLAVALARGAQSARAIVTVHPNNPTGSFLKHAELALLVATGLPIISDEVFADYTLRPEATRVTSALAAAEHSLVFRLAGLSKTLALPQLKLAFTALAGPAALVGEARARLEHIADAFLSPAGPVQLALPRLLGERPRVQAQILARIRANLARLERALLGSAASTLRVEGGWYAIVQLPDIQSDESWCLSLLQAQRVVVQPGYFFDLPGTHVVLSLIVEEARFAEGIARLRAELERQLVC